MRSNVRRFYIFSVLCIFFLPLLWLVLYEMLGGGILNGFAESTPESAFVNPSTMMFLFSLCSLASFLIALFAYIHSMKDNTVKKPQIIVMTLTLMVPGGMTLLVVGFRWFAT